MDKGRWEGILGICVFSKLCLFLMALPSSQLDGSVLGGTGRNWGSPEKDWESLGQHREYWEPLGQHREVAGSTKQLTNKGCTLDTKLTWV